MVGPTATECPAPSKPKTGSSQRPALSRVARATPASSRVIRKFGVVEQGDDFTFGRTQAVGGIESKWGGGGVVVQSIYEVFRLA